jgi:hypothetical protein
LIWTTSCADSPPIVIEELKPPRFLTSLPIFGSAAGSQAALESMT